LRNFVETLLAGPTIRSWRAPRQGLETSATKDQRCERMSSLRAHRYQRRRLPVNPPLDKMYPKRDSTGRGEHSHLRRLVARVDSRGAMARLVSS